MREEKIYIYTRPPCVYATCMWVSVRPEKGASSYIDVVTGSFEPSCMGAGIQTQTPWKSGMQA